MVMVERKEWLKVHQSLTGKSSEVSFARSRRCLRSASLLDGKSSSCWIESGLQRDFK